MKYIMLLSVIILSACGDTDTSGKQTLEGAADVNINSNFAECEIRQNGNSLIVKYTGNPEFIFIFDPAVLYADEYIELTAADALRISPYSAVEQQIVDGTL